MKRDVDNTQRKRPVKKIIAFLFLSIVLVGGIFLYNNFNRLLSDALLRTFDSNIISDVYELKFEKLTQQFFKYLAQLMPYNCRFVLYYSEEENEKKESEYNISIKGKIRIQIDGAMNNETIQMCRDYGADDFVMGSAYFGK